MGTLAGRLSGCVKTALKKAEHVSYEERLEIDQELENFASGVNLLNTPRYYPEFPNDWSPFPKWLSFLEVSSYSISPDTITLTPAPSIRSLEASTLSGMMATSKHMSTARTS